MTPPHMEEKEKKCKKPHIKKPLNAFMLFMKEMRAKVIEECTLKESAAINQILGRKVCLLSNTTNPHSSALYSGCVFLRASSDCLRQQV